MTSQQQRGLRIFDGDAAGLSELHGHRGLLGFLDASFRGVGQITLMNNPITGAIIVIALLVHSVWLGVAVLAGLLVCTLSAIVFGFASDLVRGGLHGFNGALVGAGVAVFVSPAWSVEAWTILVLASIVTPLVTAAVMNAMTAFGLPALTLPFNFVLIPIIALGVAFSHWGLGVSDATPAQSALDAESASDLPMLMIEGGLRGISQLFLADSWISGLIILAGIMMCSRISAVVAYCGALLGCGAGLVAGATSDSIVSGLWGYNSYITALALVGIFFYFSGRVCILGIIGAIVAAVLFGAGQAVSALVGVPVFTLPFCFATLALLAIGDSSPWFVRVPVEKICSPERVRLSALHR